MIETLIMANVANRGLAPFVKENIDIKILPAPSKVDARKNTQVIFTRKKVNRAYKNLVKP